MGKAKKIKVSKREKNLPLSDQITKDDFAVESSRPSKVRSRQSDVDSEYLGGRLSKQILSQARKQLEEVDDEMEKPEPKKQVKIAENVSSDEEEEDEDGEDFGAEGFASELHINQKDEAAFNRFMSDKGDQPRRTLADIIQDKLTEKRTEIDTQFTDPESLSRKELDPKVVEMYEGVGKVMSRYRSGKVPKAFKVIPFFQNWEKLALLTRPDEWTAAATLKATKIFTSGLNAQMAQRFFNVALLPRIRDDIDTYQRLNFHLYQALRKALFKPGAFFKGFLLPLCEAGDCTLREAIIIGSVLAKCSIPMLHSAAVMLKIAEMEYTGANSIFLRIFLDKKYALPFRVVDAMVFHFLKFRTDKRELPVLWHQCFLTFAQRYKNHISSEQRDALLEILKVHNHRQITPELRRELQNAECRDLVGEEPMME